MVIKFRAWDKKKKDMLNGQTLEELLLTSVNGNFKPKTKLDKELKIMQYTGLSDKHGKEIYEGDVVTRGRNLGGQEQEHHIVIFDYDFLSFLDRTPENIIEVIGNIYENSEPLDNK